MKAKILVVDDDAHLRESLKDNLELDGYEVFEADSGQAAMRCVVTGFYDVILMDFNLADSNGIEVIRQIRKVNTESQILMMTAHASLDTAVKAIQEAVYDFLIKPVDFNYLKRVIAKCLEGLRLRQENRRLIEELKSANEQLLNLNNMKSKFLSMSSHDLSNSLMTLQVSFEMLAKSLSPDPEQQTRIQYISSGISQIARLIEDLVDWASIEQGKLRLEKNVFRLEDMVTQALVGPKLKAAQRGIELASTVEDGLPMVMGDQRRLSQVLVNLLENAIRHTTKGGRVGITVSRNSENDVQAAVQDTGEGIDPKEVPKLFTSFYQGAGSGQHGRLGLGLSIAREIVQSHNGKIWVESEGLGKGARFCFSLPAEIPSSLGGRPSGASLRGSS